MVPDKQLEALKAKYWLWKQRVLESEEDLEHYKWEAARAYAELNVYLNKAENSFQDTEGEGF